MDEQPVPIYYVPCREERCWVLFATKSPLPLCLTCRVHGHALDIESACQGLVTEFEATQGWTRQKPD